MTNNPQSENYDSKYVVLKRKDWKTFQDQCVADTFNPDDFDRLPLNDAVVLRLQDITVAPSLHVYASIILSFIELLEHGTNTNFSYGTVTEIEDMKDRLQRIADYMHEQALRSESMSRKMPD